MPTETTFCIPNLTIDEVVAIKNAITAERNATKRTIATVPHPGRASLIVDDMRNKERFLDGLLDKLNTITA